MTLVGLGVYLAYVPISTILFERIIAATHFVGTAVFAIYLADAAGYLGPILVQVLRDLWAGPISHVEFLSRFALAMSIDGTICLMGSWWFFLQRAAKK